MKKIIITCLVLLICSGCHKVADNKQFDIYSSLKENLSTITSFSKDYPFQVNLTFKKWENKYLYNIIIDQPKVDMYNIVAMAYANEKEEQMCPTLGIFDKDTYSLRVGYVDKSKGFYKGIQLSGECDNKQSIHLFVQYYTDEEMKDKVEKYIEVK